MEENDKNTIKKVIVAGILAIWFGMVKTKAVKQKGIKRLIKDWALIRDTHGKKEKSSHHKYITTDQSPCGPGIKVVFSTGSMARGTYTFILKDLGVPQNEWPYYM